MGFPMFQKHSDEHAGFRWATFPVAESSRKVSPALTSTQVRLIRLRKRLMAFSVISVLLLCGFVTLHQATPSSDWPSTLFGLFEVASIFVLFFELMMIVLISCCNLTKSTRH
jgi:hypothetical protein